ncbi:D-aminoacylase [Isosphaeraceae bacterium EP7]
MARRPLIWWLGALLLLSPFGTRGDEPRPAPSPVRADVVLKGGLVVDGTGAPGKRADVAILGERIVAVGSFKVVPGAKVIDASRWVVAPGFIDLHTHSDTAILQPKTRPNLNYQAQGVTTIVTGNCGSGPIDVGGFLKEVDKQGAGTNVIHLIPHGSLRQSVLGNAQVKATPEALATMASKVDQAMRQGAWGMSTGLIYVPGMYADTAELVSLAKVVGKRGGIYASHMRDEGTALLDSIDETLTIGREAKLPVHISHLKASGKAAWGLAGKALERIEAARAKGQRVTADQYPYIASSTRLAAMVVPHWARQGNADEFRRIADDPVRGAKLRAEISKELEQRSGGASVRIARYARAPGRVGKNLVEIAAAEQTTPLEVVLDIERNGGAQAISFGMDEAEVRQIMTHDYVATASDGGADVPGGPDKPHPRVYGTFPRKIRYALDDKVITLEQAVRSSSGLPAEILHLRDRGVIREGAYADLVVFDPKTFRDAATFDDSTRYAPGVAYLFVNGVAAIAEGKPRRVLPGRALRLTTDGPSS